MSWWRLQWNVCSYPTQFITAHLIHCCSTWRCQNWSGGCQGSVPPWRFGRGNFMNPPEGFPLTVSGHVWKLKKSIYSLKQAAHMCKAVHELTCESLGLVFPWFWVWLELFPTVPSQIKSRNHTDSFILLPKYNPYKQYLLWLDLTWSHGKNKSDSDLFPTSDFHKSLRMTGTCGQPCTCGTRNSENSWNPWICAHHFRHAVFVHQNGECIAFHVDDMLTMARGFAEMTCMKEENAGCFKTKDLGKVHHFCRFEITQGRSAHTITVAQSCYSTTQFVKVHRSYIVVFR